MVDIRIFGSDDNNKIGKWLFHNHKETKSIAIAYGVTEIEEQTFSDCTKLTTITIPSTVKKIGKGAFRNCEKLKKIIIPNGITEISDFMFSGCISLTEVVIPNSVIRIGKAAFRDCTALKTITIPSSVTEISENAFSDCISLKTIQIPERVTKINDEAFTNCTSLTEVKIENGVKEIGKNAFFDCKNLIKVEIPNSVIKIGYGAFYSCEKLKKIVIPNSINEIGPYMFFLCTKLKQIMIPDNVRKICNMAFGGCISLIKVDVSSLTIIESDAFFGCYKMRMTLRRNNLIDNEFVDFLEENKELEYNISNSSNEDSLNNENETKEKSISLSTNNENEIIEENINFSNDDTNNIDSVILETVKPKIENQITDNHNTSNVSKNHHENILREYASTLGLESWVDKLRATINIALLCSNIPKNCFYDISHDYLIREILQCLSENINYDYNSAIKEYVRYYVESHQVLNKTNLENNEPINDNYKVSLDKEPIDELSLSRKK